MNHSIKNSSDSDKINETPRTKNLMYSFNDPEFIFLALLVREFISSNTAPMKSPDTIEWSEFKNILYAKPRSVLPLGQMIYQSDAPMRLKAEIATAARPLLNQTQDILNELPILIETFNNRNIPFTVLKGPSIAHRVYREPQHRLISDIDLLFDKSDLAEVYELMQYMGYTQTNEGRSEEYYDIYHFHKIFKNDRGIHVEVHWDLTVKSDFVRFDLNQLMKRNESVTTDGYFYNALSLSDTLLHIVSQSMPAFNSLGRMLDILVLIKSGALNHSSLASCALQYNLSTPLWLALGLAENYIDDENIRSVRKIIQPNFLKRACLNSLPLNERLLGSVSENTGVSNLNLLLITPNAKEFWGRLIRIIFPSKEDLYVHENSPSLPTYKLLMAWMKGMGSVVKMIGYLIWRIACTNLSSNR